jgi:hypothetical protein
MTYLIGDHVIIVTPCCGEESRGKIIGQTFGLERYDVMLDDGEILKNIIIAEEKNDED